MYVSSLQLEAGGRPVANDDFQVLQDRDTVLGLPGLLTDLGPCVVSGCRVYQTGSVWNVGPGLVWDGSQLLPFAGQSNVALPAMFAAGAVVVLDERAYQTGGTKTTIKGQAMELVAVDPAATSSLVVDTKGALTFWQRAQEKTREVGTAEYVTDTTGYDATGLGVGPKRGWALANGQNKTADLRGQFVVGLDPTSADYVSVGQTGGEATHTLGARELPVTSVPRYNGRITFSGGDSNGFAAQDGGPTSFGGSQAHENRPPFYVLAARQWMGF